MASHCFCGCGRRVRFGKKRLSRHGARAAETVKVLREVSLTLVRADPEATRTVQTLIDHGDQIRDLYQGIIHGTALAPKMDTQRQIFEWENTAPTLAAKHLRMIAAHSEVKRQAEAANPVFAKHSAAADFILGPSTPAEEIANMDEWVERVKRDPESRD